MIPADQRYPIRIPHLQAKQQQEGFERVETAVDEIPHEQVIRIRHVTAHAEEFHQVVKLAVDVAADGDGGVDGNDIALFDQQFARFVAELSDLRFGDRTAGAELGYRSVGLWSVSGSDERGFHSSYLSRSLMMGEEEFQSQSSAGFDARREMEIE